MYDIELHSPHEEHEEMALNFISEHFMNNEPDIHGGALIEKLNYKDWLMQVRNNSMASTVSKDWVVSSTFFAIRKIDGEIIGMLDMRHTLNDFLRLYGGHIGFSVRPSERRKGYATQILKQGLEYAKTIGLEKVMLACYKNNAASRNTIVKCGGIMEREFVYQHGGTVQVFWISLK